jgi:hypothetical protein
MANNEAKKIIKNLDPKNTPSTYNHRDLDVYQKATVFACDELLKDRGLMTYTQMEEALFAALTAANEAIQIGKSLAGRLQEDECTAVAIDIDCQPVMN